MIKPIKKIAVLATFIVAIIQTTVFAVAGGDPLSDYYQSARELALGKSDIASSSAESAISNAATLGILAQSGITALYQTNLWGESAGGAMITLKDIPFRQYGIRLGFNRFGQEVFAYANDLSTAEKVAWARTIIAAGLGRKLGQYSVGASVMTINNEVAGSAGATSAFSVGAIRNFKSFAVGITGRNVGLSGVDYDRPPAELGIGVEYSGIKDAGIYLAVKNMQSGKVIYSVGAEKRILNMLDLRAAYGGNGLVSAGAGVRVNHLRFDYGISMNTEGTQNIASITWLFGLTESEQKRDAERNRTRVEAERKEAEARAKESKIRDLKERGMKLYASANYVDAFVIYEEVLYLAPDDHSAVEMRDKTRREIARLDREQAVKSLIEKAKESYGAGDMTTAEHNYTTALELQPDNQTAIRGLRNIYELMDQELSVVAGIDPSPITDQEAVRLASKRSSRAIVESLGFTRKGRYDLAYNAFREIQKSDPDNTLAKKYIGSHDKMLANVLSHQYKKWEQLSAEGKYYNALLELDTLRYLPGLSDETIEDIRIREAATKKAARNIVDTKLPIAQNQVAAQKYKEAVETLRPVVWADPMNQEAVTLLKRITKEAGQRNATDRRAEIDALHVEASKLYGQNNYKETKKLLLKILEIDPEDALARRYLGQINSMEGMK